MNDLIIDETNFDQYFKDISSSKPEKGDILACYTTKATLSGGDLKKDIILAAEENIYSAIKLLQKIAKARYLDSIKILREIISDILSGKSKEEVESKEYEYIAEFFYYTKREYIPEDDPHWSTLKIHNINDFKKNLNIKSKIVEED